MEIINTFRPLRLDLDFYFILVKRWEFKVAGHGYSVWLSDYMFPFVITWKVIWQVESPQAQHLQTSALEKGRYTRLSWDDQKWASLSLATWEWGKGRWSARNRNVFWVTRERNKNSWSFQRIHLEPFGAREENHQPMACRCPVVWNWLCLSLPICNSIFFFTLEVSW